jgi:hypothetical protein
VARLQVNDLPDHPLSLWTRRILDCPLLANASRKPDRGSLGLG